jgi:hemerythrin-like metal-binding protein
MSLLQDEQDKGFEIFPWNRNFETGIKEIDEQHWVLVDILNRLARDCAANPETFHSSRVLEELLSYAAYHFRSEERIWNEHLGEAEMVRNHHDSHQMFFVRIQMLRNSDADKRELLRELLEFLTHWLAFHILESDRRMALTVQTVGQGADLRQARDQVDDELSGTISILVTALLESYGRLADSAIRLIEEAHERRALEQEIERLRNGR